MNKKKLSSKKKSKMEIGSWNTSFDYRLAPCNSTKEIADARKWFVVRKQLFFYYGKDKLVNDSMLRHALKLAASCKHPDAKFLCSSIGSVKTLAEARAGLTGHDARSLCFIALFGDSIDMALLRQTSDAGYSFAQATLARLFAFDPAFTSVAARESASVAARELAFQLATLSANQGDRDGYHLLARFYDTGVGCRADKNLVLCNLRWAAYLQDEYALVSLRWKLNYLDPERWFWTGNFGFDCSFYQEYRGRIEDWRAKSGSLLQRNLSVVVFEIGRALALFPRFRFIKEEADHAEAVEYYHRQSNSCRAAINQWCLIAIRINSKINRDIRKKIALLIWASRNNSFYGLETEEASTKKRRK